MGPQQNSRREKIVSSHNVNRFKYRKKSCTARTYVKRNGGFQAPHNPASFAFVVRNLPENLGAICDSITFTHRRKELDCGNKISLLGTWEKLSP